MGSECNFFKKLLVVYGLIAFQGFERAVDLKVLI